MFLAVLWSRPILSPPFRYPPGRVLRWAYPSRSNPPHSTSPNQLTVILRCHPAGEDGCIPAGAKPATLPDRHAVEGFPPDVASFNQGIR